MKRDCPCHSGLRYAECCAPFHAGTREAATPQALMRSRYAAFALGLGEYLVRTLAATHEDSALPRAALVAELSQFAREDGVWRYSDGVTVEAARLPTDIGTLTPEAFRLAAQH